MSIELGPLDHEHPVDPKKQNAELLEVARNHQQLMAKKQEIEEEIEESRQKMTANLIDRVGTTVYLGGKASQFVKDGRKRGYYDHMDFPITGAVPFAECRIIDVDEMTVVVEHPESREDELPCVLLDTVYFEPLPE